MKRIFMGMMIMLCMSMTNVHAFGTTIHGLNGQLSDEELKERLRDELERKIQETCLM